MDKRDLRCGQGALFDVDHDWIEPAPIVYVEQGYRLNACTRCGWVELTATNKELGARNANR